MMCRYRVSRNIEDLKNVSIYRSYEKQVARLNERRNGDIVTVQVCGEPFTIFRGVYKTGTDTELMAHVVKVDAESSVLEIGCGCGAISILIARKCKYCLGVDINNNAIENAIYNKNSHGVNNIEFIVSDVYQNVQGEYDIIICNPPYNSYNTNDCVDKMFWDNGDIMKKQVLQDAGKYLKHDGRLYFGWADFADLDPLMPIQGAEAAGMIIEMIYSMKTVTSQHTYYVLKMKRTVE